MVHSCNSRMKEVEVRRSQVQGHPQLHNQFEASLGYMKSCFKKKSQKQNNRQGTGQGTMASSRSEVQESGVPA